MEFYGKALYNLLRSKPHLRSNQLKSWQIFDYRLIPEDQIFLRLAQLGLDIDKATFLSRAESYQCPEELSQVLLSDVNNPHSQEEAFLLLFEAWRRLLPHKQSLSIFCDELDHVIDFYDQSPKESDERVGDMLDELENILDVNADEGQDPTEIFHTINSFCAHDIEGFIYDYIDDQINNDNEIFASELLDGFYDYVADKRWFDLLRIRLVSSVDTEEASIMLSRFLEIFNETYDLDLGFELLRFLIHWQDEKLFKAKFKEVIDHLELEGDLQQLLDIAKEYFEYLGKENKYQETMQVLIKRRHIPENRKLGQSDIDVHAIGTLIMD